MKYPNTFLVIEDKIKNNSKIKEILKNNFTLELIELSGSTKRNLLITSQVKTWIYFS